jgi:hypothetical protein
MKKFSSRKIYFKGDIRYILFKYFKEKFYYINETDKEIQKFNGLKEARDYLRKEGIILNK